MQHITTTTRPTLTVVEAPSEPALARSLPTLSRPVEVQPPGLVRTSRMVLRAPRVSDKAELLRVVKVSKAHLEPWSTLHREGESDEDLVRRQIEMARVGDERGTAWRRIGVLEDGRIAGAFNLNSISRGLTFDADANWWIAGDCLGQGLGTEGVEAMLDFALLDIPRGLGLHRVTAAIAPGNEASLRVAQRVGLKPQPDARVSVRVGGRWMTHSLFARGVLDPA